MASRTIDRRAFIGAATLVGSMLPAQSPSPFRGHSRFDRRPNVILINADDLGYGDLGCYGSKIPTPNLDAMAGEGVLFSRFQSASPVCSPSRAALLTGRYSTRVGVPKVLFPNDQTGLPDSETTIAQMLKAADYSTMCVGKWHLGSQPQFLPTNRGFDAYFGLPYSNDMLPLPLLHNTDVMEQPANLNTLTLRYTQQAVSFITRSKDSPFFLYMAHSFPHIPLAASQRFRGKSGFGLYGDAVAEIDWSVGQVLRAIQNSGIDGNTLVLFSSDHGPWYLGSPGPLRGRKGETWEGGTRVPLIARAPGLIPPGMVQSGIASALDILPTLAKLCNAPLPANPLDGVDITPLLTGAQQTVDRDLLVYFDGWEGWNLQAARLGKWKLHVSRYDAAPLWGPDPPGGRMNLPLPTPELYDTEADPGESYNLAIDNPQIVADIRARIEALLPTFPDRVNRAWQQTM
ncbi:MAG TPA: sulfatase, partial [Bryobacterales bacterium]|nr:sulfatase [Bryobacterales bacterium]